MVQSADLQSHTVRLSVTLVDCDHIGWKSWKLTAPTIRLTLALRSRDEGSSPYSQGNMEKSWGHWRWVGKSGVLQHKSDSISETHKDRGKVTMDQAYRNLTTLFRAVPPRPPIA